MTLTASQTAAEHRKILEVALRPHGQSNFLAGYVIDISVATKWIIDEEESEAALAL